MTVAPSPRRDLLVRALHAQGPIGDASSLDGVLAQRTAWTPAELARAWADAAQAPHAAQAINHVYLHVPFCKSICHFCNYERLRPSDPALLRAFADRLRDTVETLAPGLAHHRFHTLYVGGGTPSVLPADLARQVLSLLDRHVPFVPGSGRYVEMDPAVVSEAKVRAFVDHGFTHFSFGVQSFDRAVNEAHDRGPQTWDLVDRRIRLLRDHGVRGLSLDFLLGLAGTTPADLLDDIDRALRVHRPSWVHVYYVTPTDPYVRLHFGGAYDAFWAHQRNFADIVPAAIARIAAAHGYRLGGSTGHYHLLTRRPGGRVLSRVPPVATALDGVARALRHHPGARALVVPLVDALELGNGEAAWGYTQDVAVQDRPLNLLGLGHSARSRLFGRATAVCRDAGDDPLSADPAVFEVATTDLDRELRTYALTRLRNGHPVRDADCTRLFGRTLAEAFPGALSAWRGAGLLRGGRGNVALHAASRQAITDALIDLFSDAEIEAELARFRKLDLRADALAQRLDAAGTPLADGWTVGAAHDRAIHVVDPGGQPVPVRVVPPLDRTTGVDLLAPDRVPAAVTGALRAMLAAHGADALGLKARVLPEEPARGPQRAPRAR